MCQWCADFTHSPHIDLPSTSDNVSVSLVCKFIPGEMVLSQGRWGTSTCSSSSSSSRHRWLDLVDASSGNVMWCLSSTHSGTIGIPACWPPYWSMVDWTSPDRPLCSNRRQFVLIKECSFGTEHVIFKFLFNPVITTSLQGVQHFRMFLEPKEAPLVISKVKQCFFSNPSLPTCLVYKCFFLSKNCTND